MIEDQFMFGVPSTMEAKLGLIILTWNGTISSYQLRLEEEIVPNASLAEMICLFAKNALAHRGWQFPKFLENQEIQFLLWAAD